MKETNIPFIPKRRYAYAFSLVMFVTFMSVAYMRGGINWGIDFVGGVKATFRFDSSIEIGQVRETLDAVGIPNSVQEMTSTDSSHLYIISTKIEKGDQTGAVTFQKVQDALKAKYPSSTLESNEVVGPSIGEYLKGKAWQMTLMCMLMMTIYLWFRFELRFSVGAMIALMHDIILTIALAAAFRIEFDIPVLAAILTIFGYSVNDTIVIFDRIRERMAGGSNIPFPELVNSSINQTLSRTVITVFCTLLSVIAIFFFGGAVLHGFAAVLIFGFVIGAYSSIFIASPVVIAWDKYIKPDKD